MADEPTFGAPNEAALDPALLVRAFDSPDFPIGCFQLDRQLRILSASTSALALMGGTREDVIGVPLKQWRFLRVDAAVALHEALLALSPQHPTGQVRTDSTDQSRQLEWFALRSDAEGEVAYILVVKEVAFGASEEGAQRRLQNQMTELFDASPLGEAYVSVEGEFMRMNQAFCDLLGYTEGELRRLDFQSITHPEDLQRDLMLVNDMLDGRIRNYSLEKRYIKKNGEVFWVNLFVSGHRDEQGKVDYFISVIEDISTKKQMEARYEGELARLQDQLLVRQLEVNELNSRILKQAMIDPVTDLLNEEGLNQEMGRAFALASEDGEPFAVIELHLEGFDAYAREHGFEAGNAVLKEAAHRLRNMLRRSDIIGRRARDNFVVALDQRAIMGVGVDEIARRVCHGLADTFELGEHRLDLKVSCGTAVLRDGESLESVLARAKADAGTFEVDPPAPGAG